MASGIWEAQEYAKLTAYDAPTFAQPTGLFLCHQTDADDAKRRLCAGWVGCHGDELLALRLATARGALSVAAARSAFEYASPIPLFASGAEAKAHGVRDIDSPSADAQRLIDKIVLHRPSTAG